MLSKLCRTTLGAVTGWLAIVIAASPAQAPQAQSLTNASFESPAVNANTDSLRPTGATWAFTGQSGLRNNSAPNGSAGKQAAFLSAAPVSGNNNFGSVRQTITLKPGTYYVRYLAAVKTPSGRPQPFQFYVNSSAQGGVLKTRYLTDTTTGGFEAGWTQPFVVTTAGSYELRFDATNATNYGTVAAPLYAVSYLDAITVVSVPGAFANSGFETTNTWTLSSGATQVAATDAPEGAKVLSLASAATAAQTLSLPTGRYSVSLNIGKASLATGTLNVEVASNGAAAVTVATISASTAAEYRTYTTAGFALAAGTHVVTLRASGSAFSLDNIVLNDAAPDAVNAGFETPVLTAPSSATSAGTTSANPTNATWAFTGTGGLIQTNAGASNTSAPRTVASKQYLALSGTGAVAQSLAFAGGTYVAIGQVAQGGLNVLIDGTTVGKLSASTLDFREVMSAPFVVAAGTHSLGLAVDSTYTPATPKLDEIRLLRVDVPPVVGITAPANGALYQTGATVNITANASDPDGLGSLAISTTPSGGSATQLAASTSSPLSTSWTNVSANSYTITATATDSTGATNATAINIRVNANPNVVVSLSPAGPVVTSATAVATTVTVSSATDSDGTVTKVEFLQDGVVAATCTKTIPPAVAPFVCALSLAPRATAYSLTVRVTDNDGGITTTAPLSLRVNTPPTVTLVAACVAPCTAPATVNLTATPTDTDGTITKVEFYDGATLLTTKAAVPWTFAHTNAASGSHSYTAKAFDNDNASQTSTAQAINVSAPTPSVALTAACAAPCNAPASVTLTAVPANIVGAVSKVEFYDGATLLNTDTASPYSFAATSVAAATRSYSAKVYVTGTTAAVATSLGQAVRVNALPTVTLTAACVAPCVSPATVNLTSLPEDSDGTIAKVEFYDGATLLTSKTASPWTYSQSTAATGSHSYTVKAFDDSKASTTSTAQAITVAAAPASIALTAACIAPCNAPAAVILTAASSNIAGTISKVEFYDGATLLNSDTTNPYSFAAAAVVAATHSYAAKVYVTGITAAVATSATQTVRVNALPSVTLTATCVAPCALVASVNLAASPSDSDGTISKVEFYDGATLLGANTSAPWTFTHTTAGAGMHNYTAKAFDNDSASKASATKTVIVAATAPPTIAFTVTCDAPCVAPAAMTLVARPSNIVGGTDYVRFTNSTAWIDAFGGYGNAESDGSYSYRLSDAAAGTYSFNAVVSSPSNAQMISDAVNISVAAPANYGPAVDWVSPPNNSDINAEGTFVLSVAASDIDGSVASVVFYSDGALLGDGVLQGGAYRYTLRQPSGTVPFRISAIATDNLGKTTTSTVRLLWRSSAIQFDPIAPPVRYINRSGTTDIIVPTYVTPTPGDVQGPSWQWKSDNQFVPWIVELIENDIAIATQKYGYENVPISTGRCDYSWTDPRIDWCISSWPMPTFVVASKAIGSYRYALRIKRREGVIWQSADATITVADPAPTVTITSPTNGGNLFEGNVNLSVTVSAIVPVSYASFYEGSSVIGSCLAASGSCIFNWQRASVGSHTVSARITDANGLAGTSAPITFVVLANARPTLQFVSPAPYTAYRAPATVTITASASDADGSVTRVQFLDQNSLPLGDGTLSNGLYRLTLSNLGEAQSIVRAQSTDNRGATSDIDSLSLRVLAAPSVSLWARCDAVCYAGDTLIDLQSNYNTSEITRVRYLRDGAEIANLSNPALSSLSSFRYLDRGGSIGTHSYQVEITTLWGEIALSAPVSIDAVAHAAPVPAIASPASGASFVNTTTSIALRALISQSAYDIVKVEFFRDNTVLMGVAAMQGYATYVLNWTGATGLAPGSYSLTARATDIAGGVGTSPPISFNISIPAGPQAAAISSPATGSEFPAGQTVTISAASIPPDPTITRIELRRVGGGAGGTDQLLASVTSTTLTYAFTLPSTTQFLDLYTYAFNAAGGRTKSPVVTLTSRADVTDPRYFVWTNFNAALMVGNKALALTFLTPTAQEVYATALSEVVKQIALFAASSVPGLSAISVNESTADYLVASDVAGTRILTGIRFMLMDDGKWKIDSM